MKVMFIVLLVSLTYGMILAQDTMIRLKTDTDAVNTGAWPTLGGNIARTSKSSITSTVSNFSTYWSINLNARATGPAIENEKQELLIGTTDGYVHCISSQGQEKWHFLASSAIGNSLTMDDTGCILFTDRGGYLYSLYFDGQYKFAVKTTAGQGRYCPAYDGSIYLINDNVYTSYLYAYRPGDGSFKWGVTVPGNDALSSPVIDSQRKIYASFSTYRMLICLNYNSEEVWRKYLSGTSSIRGISLDEANKQLYISYLRSRWFVNARNSETGDSLWTFVTSGTPSNPAAINSTGDVIFGDSNYYFYALHKDGTVAFKIMLDDAVMGSPVIDAFDRIAVMTGDGNINCIDPDGYVRTKYFIGTTSSFSPIITKAGNYAVPGNDNKLYLIGGVVGYDDETSASYVKPRVSFTASPNPFKDRVKLSMTGISGEKKILVFDITGRLVLKTNTRSESLELKSLNLSTGVYIVSLRTSDNKSFSLRLVRQ
jgi:hypothetical protein